MGSTDTGEFAPGDAFGNYQVVRLRGAGAFGEVYEAVNKLGYRVAIKSLKREVARRADVRARFLREGLSAVKIRHPNAVQVLDTGEKGDVPYLVMEFLDGEDLEGLLKRVGSLSPMGAVDILLPAMAAIAAAHDEGVIHRDLKPANLFLAKTRDGEIVPKVVDFGISRLKDAPQDGVHTQDEALMGSPVYMSPEQTRGARDLTDASDQFSLGTILYECVTGRRPFQATSLLALLTAIARADFPRPREVRPDLPSEFEAVILRAMSVEPADRFPSVRALGEALLPFASQRVAANLRRVFDPMGASTMPTTPAPAAPRASYVPRASEPVGTASTLGGAASSVESARRSMAQPLPRRSRALIAVGAVALGGVLGGAVWLGRGGAATHGPSRYAVSVEATPQEATITVDGQRVGAGRYTGAYPRDGRAHQLAVNAEGYQPYETTFLDTAPEPRVTLHRRDDSSATATTGETTPAAQQQPTGTPVAAAEAAQPSRPPSRQAATTDAQPHGHGHSHGHHHGHGGTDGASPAEPPSGSVTGVY